MLHWSGRPSVILLFLIWHGTLSHMLPLLVPSSCSLSLRIMELETDSEPPFALALLLAQTLNVRGSTLQASCNPELWSCFVSKWVLKMSELFAYLKNNSQFRIFPFALCVWVFCLQHVWVLHACLVPMEAGRACQRPWNCSYSWL